MEHVKKVAVDIAKSILNKDTNPNYGCYLLSEISQGNDSPEELKIFELLAHEQYRHEHVGATSEDMTPKIIEECERLVNNHG